MMIIKSRRQTGFTRLVVVDIPIEVNKLGVVDLAGVRAWKTRSPVDCVAVSLFESGRLCCKLSPEMCSDPIHLGC